MAEVTPDPKPAQRIVATPDEWAIIADMKQGPCRICRRIEGNGSVQSRIHLHHLIRGGDDVPENIVPLCGECHQRLHDGRVARGVLRLLPAELAYMRGFRR